MTFPHTIHRGRLEAVIYGKSPGYDLYRLAYYVAGKRVMRSFATFGQAKAAAKAQLKALAKGSQAAALSSKQAADALAAFERLEAYRKATGRTLSLLRAVSTLCDSEGRLHGHHSLAQAVDGFLSNVVAITRKDIAEAVAEFVAARDAKTKAADGKRAQLSSGYAYLVALWLGWFAKTFPATPVSDLGKEHVDLFMGKHAHLAAKSKNHLRATLRMFLAWCVKRDYLSATHRLLEAPSMERETITPGDTEFYRPAELRKLLDAADDTMRPIIALQGLAGLRQAEALRLTWRDVFATAGHVTISATKSKTRSRRLVAIVPALGEWLRPYRQCEGPIWGQGVDTFQETFAALRESLKIPAKRNGLRHAYCTFHFALHANENLTAQMAGNSPQQIHSAYKGLATKKEAAKWFAMRPVKGASNILDLPTKQTA